MKILKEKIKEMARQNQFIRGIHNYCDRWCEHCPCTDRCMSFAISEEQFARTPTNDLTDEGFWKRLSQTFEVTLELVEDMTVEHGGEPAADAAELLLDEQSDAILDQLAANHECIRAARRYETLVEAWLERAEPLLVMWIERCVERMQRDDSPAILDQARALSSAVERVRWYENFIWLKLMRALRGQLEDREDWVRAPDYDANGSAKIALIAIDRSLKAWRTLFELFPQYEDETLDLLLHLDRLRGNTENAFPQARDFIRPGLDE